ncbi:MAG: hypothetical protein IJJ41_06970 [Clostridia bacterium]|nr:hypothetical protein [Clostridia bacterium]
MKKEIPEQPQQTQIVKPLRHKAAQQSPKPLKARSAQAAKPAQSAKPAQAATFTVKPGKAKQPKPAMKPEAVQAPAPASKAQAAKPEEPAKVREATAQAEPAKPVTPASPRQEKAAKQPETTPTQENSVWEHFGFADPGKKKKPSRIGNAFRRLSGGIKKLFTPVTRLLDAIDADFSDRSPVRKTLIALFKLKAPVCILLAVVILLSGCYFMFDSNNTATTEMSLNYEEAAYGLNPNSTRFNVYDIASREVVEKMLGYCGIDPESVDINAVMNSITINPTNKKSFSEETLFITTTYRITITKPPEIKGISTDEMLNFLCKAYKDNLYSKYTENRSILSFNIDDFHDEEFMQIADQLDLKAQQIEKYLNTRAKQSKTFTEKKSDETFKSLAQKVEDLRNYDIAKYRAFVIEAGCSHNKAHYLRSLAYTNRIKDLSYDKDIAAYNVYNAGIKMYNEAMISVVMIPSIDESKNTYYMSKTKTGMDYMASQADDYLKTAQETAKEIKVNREIMGKMQAGSNDTADINKAKSMIETIRGKFATLSGQIETVDKAYIKYKTKDYLTFKPTNLSLLQKLQPTKMAVIAAVLLLAIYAAVWYRFRNYSGGK